MRRPVCAARFRVSWPVLVSLPHVCVIGAGSSGIAAAKVLHQRGIPFDCYEKSDRVDGNWVFGNRNGMSSAYRSLHINTSRERMEYSDFPMPKRYPDFPHHTHIAECGHIHIVQAFASDEGPLLRYNGAHPPSSSSLPRASLLHLASFQASYRTSALMRITTPQTGGDGGALPPHG
jgi:Flavin-binding monooxygenase-like